MFVYFSRTLREGETRHDIRDDAKPRSEHLSTDRLRIRLIDQRENRVRVRVIDELVGKKAVQERLDRGVRGIGVDKASALRIDHVLVGQHLSVAQRAEALETDRWQAGRLDASEVPSTALDAQDRHLIADVVNQSRLHRRVAAAMEHQSRVLPDQTRGVHAERNVLVDLWIVPIAFDRRLRVWV